MQKIDHDDPWALGTAIHTFALEGWRQAEGAAHVVYLMYDLHKPDPTGKYPGVPIYVGETGMIYRRLKDHCTRALRGFPHPKSIHAMLRRMIEAGWLPGIMILARCDNRTEALISETRWCQNMVAAGHPLRNRAEHQSRRLSRREMARFEKEQDWWLTYHEAEQQQVRLLIKCSSGCFSGRVKLKFGVSASGRQRRLIDVRRQQKACGTCGGKVEVWLRRP